MNKSYLQKLVTEMPLDEKEKFWVELGKELTELPAKSQDRIDLMDIEEIEDEIIEHHKNFGKFQGLSCGYRFVDEKLTKGFVGGEMTILAGATSNGKALEEHTPVMTPKGWRAIGKLKVGDTVYDGNGEPTKIIGVFPQGERSVYKMTFNKGEVVIADADHLWTVMKPSNWLHQRSGHGSVNPNYRQWSELTTEKLAEGLGKRAWRIPTATLQLPAQEVELDPYLIGLLLGDGYLDGKTPRISTADQEILAAFDNYTLTKSGKYDYRILGLYPIMRALKLEGKQAWEKSVPTHYLQNSIAVRLAVLQGLMDADGTIGLGLGGKSMSYSTCSEQLSRDVVFLAQSLGGWAKVTPKRRFFTYKNERKKGRISYHVSLYVPQNPFRLNRKAAQYTTLTARSHNRSAWRKITKIEASGVANTVCIAVASETKQYVIEHSIVTHNTAMAINMAVRMAKAGHKVLFVTLEMTKVELGSRIYHVYQKPLKGFPLIFQRNDELNWEDVDGLVSKAKALGAEIVFIDHLHYFTRDVEHQNEALGRISKEIKKNAIRHNIPIVLLAQTRKSSGSGDKQLANDEVSGSGAITQDADIVLFVKRSLDNPNGIYLVMTKNRNRGHMFGEDDITLDFKETIISDPNYDSILDPMTMRSISMAAPFGEKD